MKKLLLCLVGLFMCFSFVACGNSNAVSVIDLNNCEEGYEIPVYPNCDFKFKTEEGEIVEITNFKVVLKEKKKITEEPIDKYLIEDRYIVSVTFDGKVDQCLAGKKVYLCQLTSAGMSAYKYIQSDCIVGQEGEFNFSGITNIDNIDEFVFGKIEFWS